MTRTSVRVCFLAAVFISFSISTPAQSSLVGPRLGFVWNESDATLRPLQGIVGNATIGAPVDVGVVVTQAAALDGVFFLASAEGRAGLLVINMESGSVTEISDAPAHPSRIASSRRNTAAALYYAEEKRVVLLAGLPDRPSVIAHADLGILDESPTQLAVSDDGTFFTFAARSDVYGWSVGNGARVLTAVQSVGAMSVSSTGDVLVTDSEANEVFRITDPLGGAARQFLADVEDGVSTPVAIRDADNDLIYVGNAGADTVLTLDPQGNVVSLLPCGCELSGLYPLRSSIYRLSARADETLYLLETAQAGDRVLFVPTFRSTE